MPSGPPLFCRIITCSPAAGLGAAGLGAAGLLAGNVGVVRLGVGVDMDGDGARFFE